MHGGAERFGCAASGLDESVRDVRDAVLVELRNRTRSASSPNLAKDVDAHSRESLEVGNGCDNLWSVLADFLAVRRHLGADRLDEVPSRVAERPKTLRVLRLLAKRSASASLVCM